MQLYNKALITNAIMNTTLYSSAFNVQQLFGVSIQATFTDTPTGTLKLQASSDPATSYLPSGNGGNTPVNWTDIAGSSYPISAAGNAMWNVYEIMYNWIRLSYIDSSGGTSTAVLNAQINAKGP